MQEEKEEKQEESKEGGLFREKVEFLAPGEAEKPEVNEEELEVFKVEDVPRHAGFLDISRYF